MQRGVELSPGGGGGLTQSQWEAVLLVCTGPAHCSHIRPSWPTWHCSALVINFKTYIPFIDNTLGDV